VAAADFFEFYLTTAIAPDEILTEIASRPAAEGSVAFWRFRRHGGAIVAAASWWIWLTAGLPRRDRPGGGPRPVCARAAERLLAGQRPTATLVADSSARGPPADPPRTSTRPPVPPRDERGLHPPGADRGLASSRAPDAGMATMTPCSPSMARRIAARRSPPALAASSARSACSRAPTWDASTGCAGLAPCS
jgi:hypothetical protein